MRTLFRVAAAQLEKRFEGSSAGPGSPAGAEVQESGRFPGAALGGAAGLDEEGSGRVIQGEGRQGIGKAREDDGQLIIEVMRGSGSHGSGAIVAGKTLHKPTVAAES